MRKPLILLIVGAARWCLSLCSAFGIRGAVCPPSLILLSSSLAMEPSGFDHTTVTRVIFPTYMKTDRQRLERMGYIKHSQIPESVKTVSWNWLSRSTKLRRLVPKQPYEHERMEVRLPHKPVIPVSRCGAKPVDSEDAEEEMYVSRGYYLPYLDYLRSCSHLKDVIPISADKGASVISESNSNRVRNNRTS